MIKPRDAGVDGAEDFVGDGVEKFGEVDGAYFFAAVFSDESDFVPATHARHRADIDQSLVHCDAPHNRATTSAHQYFGTIRKSNAVAVAVTHRDHRNLSPVARAIGRAVA